jgi:hypothetical protein
LIPKGDVSIAAAPTPTVAKAPSQQISHGDSGTAPSTSESGSVHSAIKSAKIWDFMALRFSKSTMCSESSITHLMILPKLSLFPKMSFSGWLVRTLIVCALK